MPAMPMNEAADRYSPEIADAFQPTETERPATKKSLAVFEVLADRNPITMVATTVTNEKAKIHGSTPFRKARGVIMESAFDRLHFIVLQRDRAPDEAERDDPHKGKEQHAEDEPREGEPEHAGRHEGRRKIIEQRHAQENDKKEGGAD